MREQIARFWRGELPLGRSFWTYAVLYGAILHISFTSVAAVLFAADAPAGFAIAAFLLPNVFTIAAVVGVWRSASRFAGGRFWADLAKAGAICWAILGVFI